MGDAILVVSGSYPGFVVHGFDVTIEAFPNQLVLIQGGFSVRGLASNQSVVIRGLEVVNPKEVGLAAKSGGTTGG